MKPSIVTLLLALGLGVAPAQVSTSTSSHSGWSIQDTLETAPDMVVGTVAASDCADSGTQVACRTTVRVLRVVKGGLAPQANIQVHWDYHPGPMDGPEATRHVPDVTALWFLRLTADGVYTPFKATFMPAYGGVFVRVPAEPPGGDFFYATDATPQYKIAHEVGAAMVADNRDQSHIALNGYGRGDDRLLDHFSASRFLAQILSSLPAAATKEVYVSLARSPAASLEAVGIAGRLRAGDASALIQLDQDLSRLSNLSAINEIGANIPALTLRGQPAAAQALARLALSETEIPMLEHFAPLLLASTQNVEFLPVMIAMLHSPLLVVRGGALFGACTLLRSREPASAAHCPAGLGQAYRGQEENIRFWIEWWQTGRRQNGQLARLNDLPIPMRYAQVQAPVLQPQPMEMPMTERFFSMMHMIPQPTHYHTANGEFHEGDPTGGVDMFSARMSAEDHAALIDMLKGVNARLEAIDVDANKMMSEARFTGGRPDIQQMHTINDRRTEALKSGLASLPSKLSPEGWAVVDRYLREMNISGGMGGPQQ
jgi:hypothetical protein